MGLKRFLVKMFALLAVIYVLDGFLGLGLVPPQERAFIDCCLGFILFLALLLIAAYMLHRRGKKKEVEK